MSSYNNADGSVSPGVVLEYDGAPVSEDNPLPTSGDGGGGGGSATAGRQDTGNTSLASIDTKLTTLAGYQDNIEALLADLKTYTDGLETLVGTTNTSLSTMQGYVDGLEAASADVLAKIKGGRAHRFSTSFVPAASYAAKASVGGILTLTGGPVSTWGRITRLSLALTATGGISAAAGVGANFYSAAPAGTFTDAVVVTAGAADAALWQSRFVVNLLILDYDAMAVGSSLTEGNIHQTDSSGRIFVALQAAAAITMTTPTHCEFRATFEY